jgi:uracil-DNA glycosylase
VVCLGAVAWRRLAGSAAPFRPRHCAVLHSGGRLLYPMYHPGYVVRGAYTPAAYARDFRRLARLCNGS